MKSEQFRRAVLPAYICALLTALALLAAQPAVAQEGSRVNIWYKLCTNAPYMPSGETPREGDVCQTMVDVRDNKSAALIGQIALRKAPNQSQSGCA